MDNTKENNLTRNILSGSKLKLENPDFNKVLMGKIKRESRKRILVQNLKLYSLIFISIDAIILVLSNLLNIRISDISIKMSVLNNGLKNIGTYSGQLILYFFIVLAIIFVINKITDTSYTNSKTQKE